jgi:hypothetical protein
VAPIRAIRSDISAALGATSSKETGLPSTLGA